MFHYSKQTCSILLLYLRRIVLLFFALNSLLWIRALPGKNSAQMDRSERHLMCGRIHAPGREQGLGRESMTWLLNKEKKPILMWNKWMQLLKKSNLYQIWKKWKKNIILRIIGDLMFEEVTFIVFSIKSESSNLIMFNLFTVVEAKMYFCSCNLKWFAEQRKKIIKITTDNFYFLLIRTCTFRFLSVCHCGTFQEHLNKLA